MEIFKLKDEAIEGGHQVGFDEKMMITDLKQGVKNPNRVNVFIDKQYAFSLDVAQVVDFKLKVGLVISDEQLTRYKKASEFGKLYQRALEWVLVRPRSERELEDYLYRKLRKSSSGTLHSRPSSRGSLAIIAPAGAPIPSEDISELSQTIIQRLISKGYVDDRKFAEFWVENRFVKKGVSRRRLEQELAKKGIDKQIVVEVLSETERNDETEIRKMIVKKRKKYDDEKLVAYLCRQGFSYDLVSQLVREYNDE